MDRTYDVIRCPLCEYFTGIASRSEYGEMNARSALVSHLLRKKHGLNRAEAHAMARTAERGRAMWFDDSTKPPQLLAAIDPHVADPGKPPPRVVDSSSEPEIQVMYGELTAREHAIRQAHDWQVAHPEGNQHDAYMVIVGLLGLLPFEEVSAALAKEQK